MMFIIVYYLSKWRITLSDIIAAFRPDPYRPKTTKVYWSPPQTTEWNPPEDDPYWQAYVKRLHDRDVQP
jgi:hypothetical protein